MTLGLTRASVFTSAAHRLHVAAKFWRLAGRELFAAELDREANALEQESAGEEFNRGPAAHRPMPASRCSGGVQSGQSQ